MRATLVLVTALATSPVGVAHAATLFDVTQTGADLAANPAVSLPDGSASVAGSALQFLTGSVGSAPILLWDILPAGVRGDLTFTIDLDFDGLTNDADLLFGFAGGGTFIGLFRFDNFNGRLTERSGTFDGANPLTDVEGTAFDAPAADIPLPNLGSNDPISATIFVADEGASASIASVSEDGRTAGPIAFPAGAAFDTDDALQFAMFRGNTGERFELKSLRVTVSGDVSVIPLPASAWLLGAGLAGIAAFARRRHRA